MTEPTDVPKKPESHESGRLLTPDEASFLQQYLLHSEPVVVVGQERGGKKPPRKHPQEK